METRDFGPFFTLKVELKENAPKVHFTRTVEIDHPYRMGYSVVFKSGHVFGIWRKSPHKSLQDHLHSALKFHINDVGILDGMNAIKGEAKGSRYNKLPKYHPERCKVKTVPYYKTVTDDDAF